jgi:O-antigen/teichoic acid export membrane protein
MSDASNPQPAGAAGGGIPRRGHQSLVSLASFFVSLLGLTVLVPVLVRQLGAREYGAWVLTGGIANWVLVFDFGLSLSVARFVSLHRSQERREAEEAITVAFCVLLLIGIVVVLVTMIVAPAWGDYLHVEGASFALRAGGIATLFVLLSKVFQSTLEGSGRVALSRVLQAGASLAFVAGGIAVVLVWTNGLVALSVFLIIQSTAVAVAYAAVVVATWGSVPLRRPSRDNWRSVLGYGLTMQGSNVLVAAVDPLSRFLVAAAAGPATVAPVDIALRARAQWFNAALAFTRPLLPELGELGSKSAIDRAGSFWKRLAPVAVAAGLFAAVASFFLLPPLVGGVVGDSARSLTAVVTVLWIPATTAIVPFLFLLLYGRARDIFIIQAVNGGVGIGLMTLLLQVSAKWAPIIGLGAGSIAATAQTVAVARRRAQRRDLFRPLQVLPPLQPVSLVAPAAATALFLLPIPLYVRTVASAIVWAMLIRTSVVRLVRDAG